MPQPKRCAGEHGFYLPRLPDSNQNGVVTTTPFDIKARAHQAMLEAGFQPDFTAEVTREVQSPQSRSAEKCHAGSPRPAFAALVFD
jgi:hypothetical protein